MMFDHVGISAVPDAARAHSGQLAADHHPSCYGVWTRLPVTPQHAVEIEKLGGLQRPVGRRRSARPTPIRRADTGEDHEPDGGHRHDHHLVGAGQDDRSVVPPHRHGLPGPVPARRGRRSPRAHRAIPQTYDGLVDYFDELDAAGAPSGRTGIAALGPSVLNLAARRSAGAHPFLTTPEHTRRARALLGDAYLAPEHPVALSTDTDEARAVGRNMIGKALGLINHVNTWKRLGFTEADLAKPGSDRLIDAPVAYGSADDIADRLNQHIEAGADHVAIRVLGGQDKLLPTLAALSEHLRVDIPRSTAVAT
jgi:hypothetical protein